MIAQCLAYGGYHTYITVGMREADKAEKVAWYVSAISELKAQACRSINAHEMTVVKADGKFYLIDTGYEGTKARDFSMYEIDEETV